VDVDLHMLLQDHPGGRYSSDSSYHSCYLCVFRFHPWQDGMLYTASSDGKVCYTDLETAVPVEIFDLNPDGWAVSPSFNFIPHLLIILAGFGMHKFVCVKLAGCRSLVFCLPSLSSLQNFFVGRS
jgi:hypothetical protein